jgi:hypothetical protein
MEKTKFDCVVLGVQFEYSTEYFGAFNASVAPLYAYVANVSWVLGNILFCL